MTITYTFDENDIKEALKEKFFSKDKADEYYIDINIKQIEAKNLYGKKYTTIIATATEI